MDGLDEVSDEDLLSESSEKHEELEYIGEELSYEPEEDLEEEPIEESDEDPEREQDEEETVQLTENSAASPVLKPYPESEVHKAEHQSPICSSEKVSSPRARFGELDHECYHARRKKHKQADSLKPESECGPADRELSNQLKDSCAFEQPGCTGSSLKRRRSRWETQLNEDEGTREDDETDCISWKLALPDLDPETLRLKADLLEIVNKLIKPQLLDDRPLKERSPSPELVYNNLGIRINTREIRLRQKLFEERGYIISKLIEKDPTFKPPHDYKPPIFFKRLYVPVKEYPEFNFIGPHGNTQKRMEMETGAKILLRGKGSSKTQQNLPSDKEELHVYIEADNQNSLDAAVSIVGKLLNPSSEDANELKRTQLVELAKLNGSYRDANMSTECGGQGQLHYPLPCLLSTLELALSGDTCSSNSMSACSLAATPPCSNAPYGTSEVGLHASQIAQRTLDKEIDNANLYVGYLPIALNENNLKDLFSVFGKITSVKVARDPVTGISKGYGFVRFESSIDAAAAITQMNGFEVNGHVLAVRIARKAPGSVSLVSSQGNGLEGSSGLGLETTPVEQTKSNKEVDLANLNVFYLPEAVDENHLIKLFAPFGEIVQAKVVKDRFTGTSRGCGFIHFRNASDAAMAVVHMNGREVDGHLLSVKVANDHPFAPSSMPSSLGNSLQGSSNVGSGSTPVEGSRPNSANLIVFYLPRAVDENCLIQLFSCFGKITKAKVVRDHTTGISKGTGFVYFENASDAEIAVTHMNGYMMEGHMLKVEVATPLPVTRVGLTAAPVDNSKPLKEINDANLFVRCIPEDVDENYLNLLFSPYGKIIEIKLMKDQTSGLKNGCGFISFENASNATLAMTHMNRFKIKGHLLEVKVAGCSPVTVSSLAFPNSNLLQGSCGQTLGTPPFTHKNPIKEINPANLYVGYLPLAADENCLMQLFSGFGKIIGVKVVRNHITGVSKGYGFVTFENAANAAEAVTYMNGFIFEGHMLAVRVAGLYPNATSVSLEYYCPMAAPQSGVSQTAWSGIPGSSSSIYQGQNNLFPTSEAVSCISQTSISSHFDSNNESSLHLSANALHQELYSLPS